MQLISHKAMLLILLSEEPGYGVDLIGRAMCLGGIELAQSGVYPALRDLVLEGFAELDEGLQRPAGSGGRPRQYYRITVAGLIAVDGWRPALRELARCGLHGAAS